VSTSYRDARQTLTSYSYTEAWDSSYATNKGQYRGNDREYLKIRICMATIDTG